MMASGCRCFIINALALMDSAEKIFNILCIPGRASYPGGMTKKTVLFPTSCGGVRNELQRELWKHSNAV